MQPEKRVKDKVKKWFAKHYPKAWHFMPVQTGFGQAGIPDHILCVPVVVTQEMVGSTVGLFVGIEAKTAVGKLSAHQKNQLEKIAMASGLQTVVWGVDSVEDLKYLLAQAQEFRVPPKFL